MKEIENIKKEYAIDDPAGLLILDIMELAITKGDHYLVLKCLKRLNLDFTKIQK